MDHLRNKTGKHPPHPSYIHTPVARLTPSTGIMSAAPVDFTTTLDQQVIVLCELSIGGCNFSAPGCYGDWTPKIIISLEVTLLLPNCSLALTNFPQGINIVFLTLTPVWAFYFGSKCMRWLWWWRLCVCVCVCVAIYSRLHRVLFNRF